MFSLPWTLKYTVVLGTPQETGEQDYYAGMGDQILRWWENFNQDMHIITHDAI